MIKQINKIVLNNNLKSCVNCVFFTRQKPRKIYELPKDIIHLSKCTKFGTKNLVSGEIDYEYANKIRSLNNFCGKFAKHFIQNEMMVHN